VAELSKSFVISAPAAAVWQLLEDFGSIERWWPKDGPFYIEHVEIEGHGVGMIRHIQNHGARHRISERLDFIDPATRTLVLSIVGTRPFGITAYVAEGRIVEIDARSCRLDYRALVTVIPGREDKVRDNILKTWEVMVAGLQAAAAPR
jgi:carbon monoxide dehydrogenase subunit G